MTQPLGSPLPALVGYYNRLEADPNQSVPGFGFSWEKIHFQVVLEPDGSLHEFSDVRDRDPKGKPIPQSLLVPDGGGRQGTGMKPFFCWDNTGYALGCDNKGKPERSLEMFKAFRELHLSFRDELSGDEGFRALCFFLEKWDSSRAESLPNWDEAAGMNVVFKLRGRPGFVHQSKAVKAAWLRRRDDDDRAAGGLRGVSLVSGREEDIARLHPMLSGVAGANTMGAAIVSFNTSSFESYGKSQSYNAPVGVHDAFRYTTALNRLLADRSRRVSIGEATVVFWSDSSAAEVMEDCFGQMIAESVPKGDGDSAESGRTISRLWEFLKAARQGRLADQMDDPEAPFYVLGLSPNASRLSVRYWLSGTVRQFAERLAQHAAELEMTGARPGDPPLVVRGLVAEIMPRKMTSETQKKYAAQLAGEIARAVLGGLPYPQAMLAGIIRRIRSEAAVDHRRAAVLKAFLIRNRRKETPVSLDKDHPGEAYQLGRLFAVLEKTQEDATEGKLNSTIKDRYFGAASATPASVFPRLLRLHGYHMNKIENPGFRVVREKLVGEIVGRVNRFPSHLSLEHQGLFYIGYYHQRQDMFTSRKGETAKETTDE